MDFLKRARSQVKNAVKDAQTPNQDGQQPPQQPPQMSPWTGNQSTNTYRPAMGEFMAYGGFPPQRSQPGANNQHLNPQPQIPQRQGLGLHQQPGYRPVPGEITTYGALPHLGTQPGPQAQYVDPRAQAPRSGGPSWHHGNSVLYVGQQQRLHQRSYPQAHFPQALLQPGFGTASQDYPPYQAVSPQDNSPQSPEGGPQCESRDYELIDHIQFYILQPEALSRPGKPDLDGSAIAFCRTCFSTRIFPNQPLAYHFRPLARDPLPPGSDQSRPNLGHEQQVCSYNLPRVRQVIQRECIPQRSLEPLLEYARFAATLPECSGSLIAEPVEYYASDHIKELAICKTCYENYIRHTSFEHGFTKRGPTEGYQWYCDLGMKKYIYRLLTTELEKPYPNFGYFAAKASERLKLNSCPGEGKPLAPQGSGSVFAYKATKGKTGSFCSECFYDYVAGTPLERAFSSRYMLDDSQKGVLACDLASPYSQYAMGIAIKADNDESWRKAVGQRGKLPPCVGVVGVDEGTLKPDHALWYRCTNYPSIEVCPMCFVTYVELLGAASLFSPIRRPLKPDVIRMCYLSLPQYLHADTSDSDNFENTLVWRGMLMRHTISHGHSSKGNWAELEYTTQMIAGWKIPCGSSARAFKAGSGRRWIGRRGSEFPTNSHDFTLAVCEECHDWYIKGSKLESELSSDVTANTLGAVNGFVCNTPNKASRDVLNEACKRGDWSHFAEFWLRREEIRARYESAGQILQSQIQVQNQANELARIQMMGQIQSQQTQLMNQLSAQQNAFLTGIGGSVAEAASSDNGQRYGNPTVGHGFLTQAGAAAAQAHHNALSSSASQLHSSFATFQPSGNTTEDTKNMLAIYEAIEAEWHAVE